MEWSSDQHSKLTQLRSSVRFHLRPEFDLQFYFSKKKKIMVANGSTIIVIQTLLLLHGASTGGHTMITAIDTNQQPELEVVQ